MTEQQFNKALGAQLRAMRKARKKKLKDIATELDISVDYVGKMERGEYSISASRLTKWVTFLGGEMQIGGEITVPNTLTIQQKKPEG
jgi:transcriptional regulator with XRE-family HTH domain